MAGPDRLPSSAGDPSAAGRIGLALAASAALHLLLAAALVIETPLRSAHTGASVPITARLEPAPAAVESNAAGQGGHHAAPPAGHKAGEAAEDARHAAPAGVATHSSAAALAYPRASDPTYYPASDLDVYPRPVAPLEIGPLAGAVSGSGAGRIRLVLLIDEYGVVNDAAIVEPWQSGHPETELRAAFAATRFIPARKDGREVKSRLLISVGSGPVNRDR